MSEQPSSIPYALAVDDDPLILMDAIDILAEAGFRTLEAGNVDDAISILDKHRSAIVLLFTDVDMPGSMNGFALARNTAQRWPHVAIVVASGVQKPGADDLPDGARFIAKPFSADLVHHHLREILPDGRRPEPLAQKA